MSNDDRLIAADLLMQYGFHEIANEVLWVLNKTLRQPWEERRDELLEALGRDVMKQAVRLARERNRNVITPDDVDGAFGLFLDWQKLEDANDLPSGELYDELLG